MGKVKGLVLGVKGMVVGGEDDCGCGGVLGLNDWLWRGVKAVVAGMNGIVMEVVGVR